MYLIITFCTIFIPYMSQTKRKEWESCSFIKGFKSKTACKRKNNPQLTQAVHKYSPPSPQHFAGW